MEDTIIRSLNVTKVYRLYNKATDRVKEAFSPFRKKYHSDFYALNDVSFEIRKGETFGIIGRNAGRCDWVAGLDPGGHVEIQLQELRQEILPGRKAVSVQHGGVQRGMGVLQRVCAGQFERAIEGPECEGGVARSFI